MKITKRAKVMTGAIALAGIATLTGGAFTAGGVSSTAGDSQFIGGEVSQTVTGAATLDRVDYTFTTLSNTDVTSVRVTFSAISAGSAVAVEVDGNNTDVTCAPVALTLGVDDYDCDISANTAVSSLEIKVTEA